MTFFSHFRTTLQSFKMPGEHSIALPFLSRNANNEYEMRASDKMISIVQRILFLIIPLINVQAFDCGTSGSFRIAGSESVKRLAEAWRARYVELCPNSNIDIEGEGSSAGAARVCGTRAYTSPVDIGGMSRDWDKVEAVTENGWLFDCERSKRTAIQVRVLSQLLCSNFEQYLTFSCIL
jgi:hypothetical protein